VVEFGGKTVVHGVNGEVSVDWNDFWKHAYHGNDQLDYAVHHLRNELLPAAEGVEQSTPHFNVSVGIARQSDFGVPVEVRVTWQDGSETDLVWAGDDWVWEYSWPDVEQPAVMVEIDPRRRLMLDRDWLNNVKVIKPSHERSLDYAVQVMLWAQQVLFYYGGAG